MPMLRQLLLVLAVFGLASVAWAHPVDATRMAVAAPAKAPPNQAARDLTLSLLDAKGRYAAATPANRSEPEAEVLAIARQRHGEMTDLLDANPEEFLRLAVPADARAGLPSDALPFVEQEADETGELEVFHVDHANPADDFYLHFLRTSKGRFSLHFASRAPDMTSGTQVRVRGVKLDNAIVLADAGNVKAITPTLLGAALPGTLGAQKTLAILVNFQDAPTQPFTVAYAQGVMFSTTSSYDYESSYQQTSLTGDVAGWFTIAESSGACNYTNIATQAKQAATAAGYALANYARYVYVFPANTCSWWGLGSVGGNPSQAWIHAKWGFTLPVVGHEMGHNFGLYHSHSLDCGTVAIATGGCVASDYGDIFDIMGSGNATPHFNAFQKERLGWLNAGVSPPLTTVAAVPGTTTYTIAPLEDARNGVPRALKIPRASSCAASNEWLYVESRQAKGFDAFLSGNANVLGGVLIHKVTGGDADSSYLLDMTPATAAWSDAALLAGQTFTDPMSGVIIAPLSVGGSASTVAVTFPAGACAHVAPTVTLTPSGTVYTSAGSSVAFSVAVQNNDGCGCGASTFDISAIVPSGWSATSARTAGIAPAGSGSASLTITTSVAATSAYYPVTMAAANTSATAAAGSATGTVAVATAAALTVSTTADKATYTLPAKSRTTIYATIDTRVSSNSAAVAGAAVTVQVTDPTGSVTTLAQSTDSSGGAKVSYALKARNANKGTYAVTSRATKGSTSGTATTSFVVQ